MSTISVTPYQNNNSKSEYYHYWYFRACMNSTINESDLADHIAADSKIERSKVPTINNAITKQIRELLCNGHPIEIPHLGTLKLGVNSEGTATVTEYNARTCIKNVHSVLTPDKEIKDALANLSYEKVYTKNKTDDTPEP